jgi:hypothetical protein
LIHHEESLENLIEDAVQDSLPSQNSPFSGRKQTLPEKIADDVHWLQLVRLTSTWLILIGLLFSMLMLCFFIFYVYVLYFMLPKHPTEATLILNKADHILSRTVPPVVTYIAGVATPYLQKLMPRE